jgi:hypothetical protein
MKAVYRKGLGDLLCEYGLVLVYAYLVKERSYAPEKATDTLMGACRELATQSPSSIRKIIDTTIRMKAYPKRLSIEGLDALLKKFAYGARVEKFDIGQFDAPDSKYSFLK